MEEKVGNEKKGSNEEKRIGELQERFAVLSDIHGDTDYLERAISRIKEMKIKQLVFLGDFDSYPILKRLRDLEKNEGIDVQMVLGNHDLEVLRGIKDKTPIQNVSSNVTSSILGVSPKIAAVETIRELEKDEETRDWWLKKIEPCIRTGRLEFNWAGTKVLFYHGSPVGSAERRGFTEEWQLRAVTPRFMKGEVFSSLWNDIVHDIHVKTIMDMMNKEGKGKSVLLVKGHYHYPRYFKLEGNRIRRYDSPEFLAESPHEIGHLSIIEAPATNRVNYNKFLVFEKTEKGKKAKVVEI